MSNKTYVSIIVIVLVVAALVFILKIKKSEAPEINTIGDETSMPLSGENTETSASLETTNSDNLIAEVKEFTITGQNFSFSPSSIKVKKGDIVKITFKNTQGCHDFVIDEFGAATKQANSPDTEVIEFTADKAGQFEYYCSVGSHRSMGMKGTLVVE